jgi:hypothetical protein
MLIVRFSQPEPGLPAPAWLELQGTGNFTGNFAEIGPFGLYGGEIR